MQNRLADVGYTNPLVAWDPSDLYSTTQILIRVDENNQSKNQIAFDVTPPNALSANKTLLNVTPGSWDSVRITGPEGVTVKMRFDGIGFVTTTEFVMPTNGYTVQFGPCPLGQAVVEPQLYHFYVEGTSVAPVGVTATFR